jgi:predicted O-methyltransferase YrrM
MHQNTWAAVDRYVGDVLFPPDPALDAALRTNDAAGLPAISVSPPQGRLLQMFARMVGARRILEIGTLGGYSTIWLGRALPDDGRLVSIEVDAGRAELARANIARAGLDDVVEVRLGRALDVLPDLEGDGIGPVDLVFIDADKESCAEYFAWAVKLSRSGSVIIVDNVVRDGAVSDASTTDTRVLGVRRLNEAMAAEPRVMATVIQTVGSKGYDGFAIARVV